MTEKRAELKLDSDFDYEFDSFASNLKVQNDNHRSKGVLKEILVENFH